MTRFTIDTNVLVYAVDSRDRARHEAALQILGLARRKDCVLMPQALAEFYHSVMRKKYMPRSSAVAQIADWSAVFAIAPGTTAELVIAAAQAPPQFQFYDALLMVTASEAVCTAIITDDMSPGWQLRNVSVVPAFDAAGQISADALVLLSQ